MPYIIAIVIIIAIPYIYYDIQHRIKGEKVCKKVKYKKPSLLKQLYIDMPKIIIADKYNKQYGEFKERGFHMICGEQGTGKTILTAYLLQEFKKQYPNLAVRTNMEYKHQDGAIANWTELINVHNGIYGQIDVLDEVHNWFNSLESKDMPPEMFGEIAYLRKQRKMIIGTTQVFTRVAKGIREQAFLVYEPHTFFNCLTITFVYKPVFDDNGIVQRKKIRKIITFVHNEELRNSYDTYKKIKAMSLKGFKKASERLNYTPYARETL